MLRKSILTIALCAGISAIAQQATVSGDSLMLNRYHDVDSVVVVESEMGVQIALYGVDSTPGKTATFTQPYAENRVVRKSTKKNSVFDLSNYKVSNSHWDAIIGGIGLGFNQALKAPATMDISMGKSIDVSWLYILGAKYRLPGTRNAINMGVGVNWRNFKLGPSSRFLVNDNDRIDIGAYPDQVIPKSSRLKIFSVTVPILYRQHLPVQLPHNAYMSFALGPVVNLNTHGSIKTCWTDYDGNTIEQSYNHIRQHLATVDILGILFLNDWLGIYARYAPMHQLSPSSPQFSAFTTGLTIAF